MIYRNENIKSNCHIGGVNLMVWIQKKMAQSMYNVHCTLCTER